jgi:hypothetical protein
VKRDEFLKKVVQMCGPVETEAIHRLAEMPPNQRYSTARKLGETCSDHGLMEFLTALIDDDLIEGLAAILPQPGSPDEAQELLKRLWTRLLTMIGPEARDVLYAHHRLRLIADIQAQRASAQGGTKPDQAYQSAVETARAILATTDANENEENDGSNRDQDNRAR